MTRNTSKVETGRLDLRTVSAEVLEALDDGDVARLRALTDARFPEPLVAPPLTDDVLAIFAGRLRAEPEIAPWWFRLIVLRNSAEVVGSIGFSGPPDADGIVTAGYSVYPGHEGRGYATEAFTALVAWALAQPRVTRVRATISPSNTPSLKVAARAGLLCVRTEIDEEEGPVEVWEIDLT